MSKFKKEYTWLVGKDMDRSHWGMSGCIRGLYVRNSETFYYGIKGIFGLRYTKSWGSYNYY